MVYVLQFYREIDRLHDGVAFLDAELQVASQGVTPHAVVPRALTFRVHGNDAVTVNARERLVDGMLTCLLVDVLDYATPVSRHGLLQEGLSAASHQV